MTRLPSSPWLLLENQKQNPTALSGLSLRGTSKALLRAYPWRLQGSPLSINHGSLGRLWWKRWFLVYCWKEPASHYSTTWFGARLGGVPRGLEPHLPSKGVRISIRTNPGLTPRPVFPLLVHGKSPDLPKGPGQRLTSWGGKKWVAGKPLRATSTNQGLNNCTNPHHPPIQRRAT